MINQLQLSKWLNLYFDDVNKSLILPEYLKIVSIHYYDKPFHFALFYYLSYLSMLIMMYPTLQYSEKKNKSESYKFIKNINRSYDKVLQKTYPINEWIFIAYWCKLLEFHGIILKKESNKLLCL
tara:strand:- start:3331 stop:3702 length:372 start_codon:yes stop_codon:yes gene_type:complete